MNRETWLEKATELLRPYFKEKGYELPEKVRVACGWPSSGGLASSKRKLGECWPNEAATDGVNQIFISPWLSDSFQVLEVLVHELLHAALPPKSKHGKLFKQGMTALDLVGKATSTKAGEGLASTLKNLITEKVESDGRDNPTDIVIPAQLPPYPQSKLDKVLGEKKAQTTRMQKLVCSQNDDHPNDDIIVRASKKVTAIGVPLCFCGKEFVIEEKGDDE